MIQLQVDELIFDIQRSNRRRTMEITVDRGGELRIVAPPQADEAALREFVQQKRYWIYKKLAEKTQLQRPIPKKQFVNGEGFLYLGRSYRLLLVDDQEEPLKLISARFRLRRDLAPDGRKHFINWYTDRGHQWLSAKVREHASRMEVDPQGVRVQDLGYRWGSCGKGGRLYFNWKTILLPRSIAEYVVAHELVHFHSPHHTGEFWRRLERVMPDYERRKAWLAAHGIEVEGI